MKQASIDCYDYQTFVYLRVENEPAQKFDGASEAMEYCQNNGIKVNIINTISQPK